MLDLKKNRPVLPALRRTVRHILILLLAQALGFSAAAQLAEASGLTAPSPDGHLSLKAEVRTDQEPGALPAQRVFVTAGTNRFAFSLPAESHLESGRGDLVSVARDDFHSLVTLRLAPWDLGTKESRAAYWRERLLAQHPGARILDEFSLSAAARGGPAFDASWNAPGGLQRMERVAFIPLADATLEVSLVSTPEAFARGRNDLNLLLLTFRASDAKGKLDLPRFSNKF